MRQYKSNRKSLALNANLNIKDLKKYCKKFLKIKKTYKSQIKLIIRHFNLLIKSFYLLKNGENLIIVKKK